MLSKRQSQHIIGIKAPLLPAKREDEHKGWIRVSEELRHGVANGAYVKEFELLFANNMHQCKKLYEEITQND